MARVDHFHAKFKKIDGEVEEIEGGLNRLPEGWTMMSEDEREAWMRKTAQAWGMPEDAELQSFYTAE